MIRKINVHTLIYSIVFCLLISDLQAQQSNKPATVVPVTPVVNPTPNAYSSGIKINYVRSWSATGPLTNPNDVLTADYTNVLQTTQYLDGLGRPLQTVDRQITPITLQTPQTNDLVSPVIYDAFGREANTYLPYVSADNNGLFKTSPFTAQNSFMQTQYTDEQVYYNQTNYEASPLNRVAKSMAPGNSWAGSNRGVSMNYMTNATDDAVRIWNIASNALTYANKDVSTNIPFNPNSVVYNAGELFKNVTIDEAGNAVVEYKNVEGQVVLKKVQIGNVATSSTTPPPGLQNDLSLTGTQTGTFQAYNSISLNAEFETNPEFTAEIAVGTSAYGNYNGFLCTYYVYDDLDQLRFVIPPKAVAQLITNGWQFTADIINELCFRYEYDNKGRMIAKKVPGADWVYMIYDMRDRLVFSQDGNQRKLGQWMTTLYDGVNRPVITGMTTWSGGTPTVLQQNVTTQTSNDAGTTIDGIVINRNPIISGATFIALTRTYYENYGWTNKTYSTTYNGLMNAGNNTHPVTMPTQAQTETMGLVTGTQVRVLSDPNNLSAGNWLTTVNFYDDHNRVIQINSETLKGTDITTLQYDFIGKAICSYLDHTNPTGTPASVHIRTRMEYDHAGRLLEIWKTINDDVSKEALIVKNEYDELGQLKNKNLGRKKDINGSYTTVPIETLAYNYNIRGWMTGINKDYANNTGSSGSWFGMELNYDKGFTINQFNGNIAGTKWRSKGDGAQRAYGYTYDNANRLLGADFAQFAGSGYTDNASINFDMVMGNGVDASSAYDENGNIKAMKQWGLVLNNSQVIDDLQYTYFNNGNKLSSVTDNAPVRTGPSMGDFTDKNTSGNDYGYDVNGNMVTDMNKRLNGSTGIDLASGAITYNYLNLPWQLPVKTDNGTDKGTITYMYDASGAKLQKITVEKGASVNYNNTPFTSDITTTTSYVNGFVYESKAYSNSNLSGLQYTDRLQFLGHEEGRTRYIAAVGTTAAHFEYDYFVKDHLGNVRMVLTEEQKQDIYPAATLEGSLSNSTDAVYTEKQYYNIDPAKIAEKSEATGITDYINKNGGPAITDPPINNNPNSNVIANSQKLYKLIASSGGGVTGLGITLKVMSGDLIDIYGKSYYFQNNVSGSNYDVPVLDILTGLLGAPTSVAAAKGASAQTLNGVTDIYNGVNGFLTNRASGGATPKAYINWILFDENFKYVNGSFDRVWDATDPNANTIKNHALSNIPVTKNGYLYVYCSNESPVKVFFDNLQVIHTRGPLLEETHYYPFGLTMAGISSKAANFGSPENKYKFNKGSELQNSEFSDGSGLEWYATQFRMFDPQLGRWHIIDPKSSYFESPYVGMKNNPITYNDPLGDTVKTKGFTNDEILTRLNRGLNVDASKSPYYFDNKGNLKINKSAYRKLSAEQRHIARNIRGAINSKIIFTLNKVSENDKVSNNAGSSTTGDDGKRIDNPTFKDMKWKGRTVWVDNKNVRIDIVSPVGDENIDPGVKNTNQESISLTPSWLVLYHELGGHAYLRYEKKEGDNQAGMTIDYENLVRDFHKMESRDYDDKHPKPKL